VTDENLTPDEETTPVDPSADAETTESPASPEPIADEPVAEEPVAPVAEEPVADEPVAEEPVADEPVADEPVAEQAPGPVAPEPIAEEPIQAAPAAAGPAEPAATQPEFVEEDEVEVAPREKPAIPGMDLIPDLATDGDQYLDAEARAAAEAEAEEAALRAAANQDDPDADSKPIADAAINLAAGARYNATGKRKSAVARVILKPGTGEYLINGKGLNEYFPRDTLQRVIRQPLETVGYESRMDVVARMHGGGVAAQAGALRHGISRALLEADPNLRGELKRRGFLTRDPRVKERKKAGLKKARKRPQFSKR
jgi:small subunit ribosomal protein S9